MGNIVLNSTLVNLYGPQGAIILQNIIYWVNFNEKKNQTNVFFDNKYWFYRNYRNFGNYLLWDNISASNVCRLIDKFTKDGLIETKQLKAGKNNNNVTWFTINKEKVQKLVGDGWNQIIKYSNEKPYSKSKSKKLNDVSFKDYFESN